ncbi:MAG TPA: hypothetical protein VI215_07435 [Bacteroidota bacterium]|jgi:hypothetical protein
MVNKLKTQPRVIIAMVLVFGAIAWLLSGCSKTQDGPVSSSSVSEPVRLVAGAGNGAPSGAHYNLNIIGVPKGKTADMTNSDGHTIFVALDGNTKIMLSPGDFQVLDRNGTDGSASFQLPNPDSGNTGTTTYSVFARALGKPGGSAFSTTCGTDSLGTTYCSTDTAVFVRNKGKGSFTNVSKELLYIYALINGTLTRIPLFDSSLQDYYWGYTNNGLRLLQLRFYQVPTTVP